MAFVLRDRVQETTATTGVGTITLAGPVAGYQAFSAIGNANTCYYTIVNGVLWESGIGTYTLAGTTLARTTILASSSGTTAITLAGTSTVFCGLPAGQQIPSAAYLTGVAGTNTITASLPVMGAYIIGQVFTLVPAGANTGAVTLNINSRGAIAITKGGATALASGELVTGAAYQLVYDGTRFLISNNVGFPGLAGVGYLEVPQNIQAAAYTLVLADSGKHIFHALGSAAATYTIPANATVAFPIGTAVTFVNLATAAVTIAITTDTMNLAGTGTTGSRTLANFGTATALKVTATQWIISGTGLT